MLRRRPHPRAPPLRCVRCAQRAGPQQRLRERGAAAQRSGRALPRAPAAGGARAAHHGSHRNSSQGALPGSE
eukprot:1133202-Alexandrium_andersonii.AAC.1